MWIYAEEFPVCQQRTSSMTVGSKVQEISLPYFGGGI